ncbi:hypothetical protein MMC09_003851 [Bachmanniomyces sp. S44760]|nr:hypothetical protein [Bachmanniomyces sp. S44760]
MTRYKLDKTTINNDLTKEAPNWILSAYGASKDAAVQLFGGYPREQSFEEMRLRHYELEASGNRHQAVQEFQALHDNAQKQMSIALNNLDGAVKFVLEGEKQHPNRIDIIKARESFTIPPAPSGYQQPSRPASGGNTSFGQSSTVKVSHPSPFGQPSGASGQPAPANPPTVWGQPPVSTPAFGQRPTFGAPSQATSTFGKPSSQPVSAFGQPSSNPITFGQPTPAAPLFGAPSQPSSSFGKPSTASAFGQPAQPLPAFNKAANPSGNLSANRSNPSPTTAFATSGFAAPSNPFQQPATTDPFGGSSAPTFGQAPQARSAANPFGQGVQGQVKPQVNSGFGQAPKSSPTGPTTRDNQNRLTKWHGQRVQYQDGVPCFQRPQDGQWEKIWFPDGPPAFNKTPELPAELYDGVTKERYAHMREAGAFTDGVMPEIPPTRDMCKWDF